MTAKTTPLETRLKRLIATSGPMDLASYMALCLNDPDHGYYTRQKPIGTEGDFTTAPEVSQLFGELVGIWMLAMWQASGQPSRFHLVELGPGRGTLMRDMIRAISSNKAAGEALSIHLVEISPSLRETQQELLGAQSGPIQWHSTIDSLPDAPLFIIGNEFFDCLPLHQWVKQGDKWHERVIGLDEKGALSFGLGPVRGLVSEADEGEREPDGAIWERSPASTALISQLVQQLAKQGGAGLFVDYGYCEAGFGDTFQALRHHAYADPLANPGEQDLTAHVNFQSLAETARQELEKSNCSLTVPDPISQGAFLLAMGLLQRAGQLGAGKNQAEQEAIRDAVERLAAPDQMGDLFKCLAIMPKSIPLPPNL